MTDTERSNHREIVTLKEHLEKQLQSIRDTMKASDKAMDVRLEAMNELRDQIYRERGAYISRVEHDAVHKSLDENVQGLMMSRAELHGKASMASVFWTGIVSFCSLLLAALSLALAVMR